MSNVNINPSSSLNSKAKAVVPKKFREANGKVVTKNVVVPVNQLHQVNKLDTIYTQNVKGVPHNLFRSCGAKFSATLEQKAFYKLENLTVRITLNISGDPDTDYALVKPTYMFERIEFRGNNGSEHLGILYDDNIHFSLITLDDTELKNVKRAMRVESDDKLYLRTDETGAGVVTFYLPMLGSWLDTADLWWKSIDGDLIIDLYPVANITDAQDTTLNSKIDCAGIDFVVETEQPEPEDIETQTRFYAQTVLNKTFLDVTPVHFYNHKMTKNSTHKFELDSLVGEYAFLLMIVRKQNSTPGTKSNDDVVSIGDLAKIDILDPGSLSMLGSGTGFDDVYLRSMVLSKHFDNSFVHDHDWVIVPFGGMLDKTFQGTKDGSFYFDGSRYYLSITPDNSFESGTYDVVIYGYKYAQLIVNKGKITSTR